MNRLILAADKATGMTYPITQAKAANRRYQVLHDEDAYDRNGQPKRPYRTPKATTPAAGNKPKEANND